MYWALCIVVRLVFIIVAFAAIKVARYGPWASIAVFSCLSAYLYARYANVLTAKRVSKLSWRLDAHAIFFLALAVLVLVLQLLHVSTTTTAQVTAILLCTHILVSASRWCCNNGFESNISIAHKAAESYRKANELFSIEGDDADSDAEPDTLASVDVVAAQPTNNAENDSTV
jgi:hypothetical protein